MQENRYLVTFSPHERENLMTDKVMMYVVYSLLPAVAVSIYFFGYYALKTYILTAVFTLGFEALFQKIRKKPITLSDNSALVTAILLAMNLPPVSPWWLILIGSFIAIVVGKQVYGGLGQNPFNPALVARVFLLISWPAQMTYWVKPNPITTGFIFDTVSTATPLGQSKTEVLMSGKIISNFSDVSDYFIGFMSGSMGEISAIALILGAAFLMYKRIISWHTPFSYIISFLIIIVPYWIINPDKTLNPMVHLFTGGLMLGAFYMATDMVTSPVTKKGQIIFGIGCGVLTAVIRLFGGYPEGVSFAILIMNAFVPIIDFYIRHKSFGEATNA
ncbi:RnfABCDGE type electron transport complex subunit D [Deferribacterales bacterium Es71-Z0220]|jgi:electron transport complex protein RnfD|uniref:RnfABCDGE type electron transport complex subunit D n=1 Tax=Deferrivibrio essentukiensis TaxID=2880922 RepID=UPI001F61EFBE|nr:RnfABCDGE type electron transport complex subunit D [Deferrivibrio essentukiensis]MCB4204704.1 RnfABCDGE type electron transport complex subunit D [Deferrivibrio essentukiensis]MDK2791361.1 H+/Na+-translocating ferredoxin:NAD+ oxidoreductase subunit [Deferribacteres bacterium]